MICRKIEFVRYNGEYPILCSGDCYYKVEGEERKTELSFKIIEDNGHCEDPDCDCHYCTVGCVDEAIWYIKDTSDLNVEEINILNELINTNVRKPCCGGCV